MISTSPLANPASRVSLIFVAHPLQVKLLGKIGPVAVALGADGVVLQAYKRSREICTGERQRGLQPRAGGREGRTNELVRIIGRKLRRKDGRDRHHQEHDPAENGDVPFSAVPDAAAPETAQEADILINQGPGVRNGLLCQHIGHV